MTSDLDILTGSVSDDDSCRTRAGPNDDLVKIVCISDTHNGHRVRTFREKIEGMEGDILIHAGDLSEHGTKEEVQSALEWLCSLKNFTHKVYIAGNMDGKVANNLQTMSFSRHNVIYLENSSCEVRGLKVYGCPYTPRFCGDFQYDRLSEEARQLWEKIPKDCDILVSHGPPAGILDANSKGTRLKYELQRRSSLSEGSQMERSEHRSLSRYFERTIGICLL
jgi:Icc-related predicted phosphoesterase